MRKRLQEIASQHAQKAHEKLKLWEATPVRERTGEKPLLMEEGIADFVGLLIEQGYLTPGPRYEKEAKELKTKKWVP